MSRLESPWTGLAALSPRRNLWGVLGALGLPAEPGLPRGRRVPQVNLWEGQSGAPGDGPFFSLAQLQQAGLSAADALEVAATPAWESRAAVHFVHAASPGWPDLLRGLLYGPVALSLEGNASLLARPTVAIVGARACTAYGKEWAGRLAASVALSGGVVVSGLATGIDCAAHAAAKGSTIAVLGQGLDAPMPAWQRRAREAILSQGGLIVSELPPGAHATAFTFPVRNRIIAGLAQVVAVIEAGSRSGARNTASHALFYGRDVLAVPGPLGAPASSGCLDLIEAGATMIRGPWTVLEVARLGASPSAGEAAAPGLTGSAAPEGPQGRVLTALAAACTPDELVERLGLAWPVVTEALGLLELTGRAIRLPGGRYQARTR